LNIAGRGIYEICLPEYFCVDEGSGTLIILIAAIAGLVIKYWL
jgi:hypothetical protein